MQMRIATQIKSGITINDDVGEKIRKSIMRAKKDYISNPATCNYEKSKYLASIIDDSLITCDKIIDTVLSETVQTKSKLTKTVSTYFTLLFINYHSITDSS